MIRRLRCALLMIAVAALTASGPAHAKPKEDKRLTEEYWAEKGFKDRFMLSLGVGQTRIKSGAQVNSQTIGLGTSINFENAFDLDSRESSPGAVGYYRFNLKSRLDFGIFQSDRDGTRITDEDIEWEDVLIPAGTLVAGRAKYTFIGAAYSYALVHTSKVEVGLSAGLTAIATDIRLATSGLPSDVDLREDITLPLPVLGVFSSVVLRPKLVFSYGAAIFVVQYDKYSGNFIDANIGIDWYPFKHVGFGAGFTQVNLNVDVEGDAKDFDGNFTLEFRGFDLNLNIIF